MAHKPRILVVDDSASVLKVVEAVLVAAGYHVETQQEGSRADAAVASFAPDLVLLDFGMPVLNGHQVAKRIQRTSPHQVPIILMCGKGDPAVERSVEALGIVDFITKPFSPDAVLALVSYTLDKYGDAADPFHAPSSPHETVTSDQTLIHTIPPELFEEPSVRGGTHPPALWPDSVVPTDEVPQVMRVTPDAEPSDEVVRQAAAEGLRMTPPPPNMEPGAGRPALWGDLSLVPLPEVFQLMTLQAQTGLFQVWVDNQRSGTPGPVRFDVYFGRGRIDFVQGNNLNEDFLLGRFLVARGAIERAELDALLRARKGTGKLLGQQLVALGYVSQEQLQVALRDQCSELVYELLRSHMGTFSLRPQATPAEFGDVRLGIGVDELLLEGLRRVDEWGVIGKEITSFDVRLEPNRVSAEAPLTDDEKYILGLVDPTGVTVRDLIARTSMRPFDVAKICYRLLMARHLRKV